MSIEDADNSETKIIINVSCGKYLRVDACAEFLIGSLSENEARIKISTTRSMLEEAIMANRSFAWDKKYAYEVDSIGIDDENDIIGEDGLYNIMGNSDDGEEE